MDRALRACSTSTLTLIEIIIEASHLDYTSAIIRDYVQIMLHNRANKQPPCLLMNHRVSDVADYGEKWINWWKSC
jgi:hypothetical protein